MVVHQLGYTFLDFFANEQLSLHFLHLGYETVILNPPSSRVNDFSSKNRHYILTWESWTPRCTPILWVPKYPNFTC
jgi:hypothetical protein